MLIRHTKNMAVNKEFRSITKETIDVLKNLSNVVPDTSNSSDYFKFLQKTLTTAKTFDKSEVTYVDYVSKAMLKKNKSVNKEVTPKVAKTPKVPKAVKAKSSDEKDEDEKQEEKNKPLVKSVDNNFSKKRKVDDRSDEPKKKVKNA